MRKTVKWGIGAVVLALVAGVAVWQLSAPKDDTAYITETVQRGTIRQTVSATGEITASNMVDVGAQVSGQIKKLHVTLGQTVKKGDLIAEIDSTTQVNTLNLNKAKLETYQAQLVSAKVALSSAQKQFTRESALWKEQATSKEEWENAQDTLAAARAKVAELKSSIKQTQITINTNEADLGYTRIVAPMDGTVVSIPVDEGQTVNANQSAPTIIQLADLSMMLNKMQIAEGDITKVKAGQQVEFTILSDPDDVMKGTLESVDPGLTTMSQGSYSKSTSSTDNAVYYYARALIPNADGKLAIGMTTQNTVAIKEVKNVLTVPSITIKKHNGKTYVRVLGNDNKAVDREIVTGLKDSMNTEVKSGLREGEKVIVSSASKNAAENSSGSRRVGPPM